jgi:hypothetical protein
MLRVSSMRPHGDVAQHQHPVLGCHCLVPTLDDGLVHGVDVGERPVAILDDVDVAQVKIGGEPVLHSPQRLKLR